MSRSHNNQLNMVSLFDEEPPRPSRKHRRNMPPCHSKNLAEHDGPIDTYRGPEVDNSYVNYAFVRDLHQRGEYHAMHGQAPPVAPVKVEEGVVSQMIVPKPVVVNNGEAVNTQFNGGLIGTHVNGFEVQFPKADSTIYETTQGIGIISGHPSDPGYPGGHPNLVKPAIATQYHQSTGMSYDFEEHLKHMEEHNFEEDLRDIEEYDFVEDGSQENLLASSSSDTGRPTSFEKARRVFTRYMHLRPRSKNSRVPFRYILEKKRNL